MAISPAGLASGPTWADAICPAPKRHRTVASPRKNCFLKTKVPFMIPLARTIVVIRDNKRPRIMGTQRLLRFRQGILVLRSSAMRPCFPHSLLSARDLFALRRVVRVRKVSRPILLRCNKQTRLAAKYGSDSKQTSAAQSASAPIAGRSGAPFAARGDRKHRSGNLRRKRDCYADLR